jgi:hypothetical protein
MFIAPLRVFVQKNETMPTTASILILHVSPETINLQPGCVNPVKPIHRLKFHGLRCHKIDLGNTKIKFISDREADSLNCVRHSEIKTSKLQGWSVSEIR